tara:strand:- start:1778 stop:1894 length:117 start_codon:yes stop_codon:yes gene_type:complete
LFVNFQRKLSPEIHIIKKKYSRNKQIHKFHTKNSIGKY